MVYVYSLDVDIKKCVEKIMYMLRTIREFSDLQYLRPHICKFNFTLGQASQVFSKTKWMYCHQLADNCWGWYREVGFDPDYIDYQ
jgi:hypothetical protein